MVTRTRVPTGSACAATNPTMRGVSTTNFPARAGVIEKWESTSAGPSPSSASTLLTGLAKMTRTCASDCAFAVGEIEEIQAGRTGLGSALTPARGCGPVAVLQPVASAQAPAKKTHANLKRTANS